MEYLADTVTAILAHNAAIILLCMALDRVTYVPQTDTGFNHFDAYFHAFVSNLADALSLHGCFSHHEHATGITMIAILDHGYVDIDDIAIFQRLLRGNTVADHVIHRSADGARKPTVVQRGRHYLLFVHHKLVANVVQCLGGNPGLDMGFDHAQYIRREAARDAHFFDFFGCFDRYTHKNKAGWLLRYRDYGIKRALTATAAANKPETSAVLMFLNDTHISKRVYGCLCFTRVQVVNVGYVEA